MQCMNAATTWQIATFGRYRNLSAAMNFTIHPSQHLNGSLLSICWCLGIKIHFGNDKHYPKLLMTERAYVLCQVSGCFSTRWLVWTMKSYAVAVTKTHTHKRGRVMLSLTAKRVFVFMLLTWHSFLNMLTSHICFLLILKLAFIRQSTPIFPQAGGTLTTVLSLPFFCWEPYLSVTCDYICWCHPPRVSLL